MKNLLFLILSTMVLFSSSTISLAQESNTEEPKLIALSFDDGPTLSTTPKILDVLEKHGVVASFFVIGQNVNNETAKLMKRAVEMGCEIENHSWTHRHMTKLPIKETKEEIKKTNKIIKKYVKRTPRFFRPPYLDNNPEMHQEIDLIFIAGDSSDDWMEQVSAQERANKVLTRGTDGSVILMHDFDNNFATVEALEIIIPELKKRGYEMVTVSELFDRKHVNVKVNNGVMFSRTTDVSKVPSDYIIETDDHNYAISSLDMDEQNVSSYSSITDYLRGRVPGVSVGPDNGGTPKIYIRGISTNSDATDPLFLVDGVEVFDISGIDPNNVASVEVLKDASASIYGMKGANGVIIIKTKTAVEQEEAERLKKKAEKEAKRKK